MEDKSFFRPIPIEWAGLEGCLVPCNCCREGEAPPATLASMLSSSPVSPYCRLPDSISTHQLNNSPMCVLIDFPWLLVATGVGGADALTRYIYLATIADDEFTPPSS